MSSFGLVYAGHYPAGLAIKASQPQAPTWALLLGVGYLDVLFGIFVMLGIERVTLTPGVSPGFSLDFIDWSHSLVMSLVSTPPQFTYAAAQPRRSARSRVLQNVPEPGWPSANKPVFRPKLLTNIASAFHCDAC
jgi:hypothetical protein